MFQIDHATRGLITCLEAPRRSMVHFTHFKIQFVKVNDDELILETQE